MYAIMMLSNKYTQDVLFSFFFFRSPVSSDYVPANGFRPFHFLFRLAAVESDQGGGTYVHEKTSPATSYEERKLRDDVNRFELLNLSSSLPNLSYVSREI